MRKTNILPMGALALSMLLSNTSDAKSSFRNVQLQTAAQSKATVLAGNIAYLFDAISEITGIAKSQITLASNLRTDFQLDELDIIELKFGMENYYEIEISDEDWETVNTVQELRDLIIYLMD